MSIVPVTNDAPGLFSTTNPTPICADICCARTRIRMSTDPPAADGRIMRIGFSGYAACAVAHATARTPASATFLSTRGFPVLAELRGAPLGFGDRDVFLVRRDMPAVPERIFDGAGAIAVELVLDRAHDLASSRGRARNRRIDVGYVEMDLHGRAAARLRPEELHRFVFVGEHDPRIADLDL